MQQLTYTAPDRARVARGRGAARSSRTAPRSCARCAVATCDLDALIVAGESPFPAPFAIGHECVAEVVDVGDASARCAPGELVSVPFQISCGECAAVPARAHRQLHRASTSCRRTASAPRSRAGAASSSDLRARALRRAHARAAARRASTRRPSPARRTTSRRMAHGRAAARRGARRAGARRRRRRLRARSASTRRRLRSRSARSR